MIPERFSPSASHGACRLRRIASYTDDTLPSGPRARIGKVLHRLVEHAAKGWLADASDDGVEDYLDELMKEEERQAARENVPPRWSSLTQTQTSRAWIELRTRFVSKALQLRKYAPARVRASGADAPTRQASAVKPMALPDGAHPEVTLESDTLRLRGRVDLLEKRGPDFEISDYKTGRVTDNEGKLKPAVVRQMALYGAMVREASPGGRITLRILGEREIQMEFAGGEFEESLSAWRTELQELPAHQTLAATVLATPGESCVGCPIRHRCSAYQDFAVGVWQRPAPHGLPLDTWGSVVQVRPRGQRATVTIRDDAGRLVDVLGIEGSFAVALFPGTRASFFELQTNQVTRGSSNLWDHPTQLHDQPPAPTDRRSWAVAAFAEF